MFRQIFLLLALIAVAGAFAPAARVSRSNAIFAAGKFVPKPIMKSPGASSGAKPVAKSAAKSAAGPKKVSIYMTFLPPTLQMIFIFAFIFNSSSAFLNIITLFFIVLFYFISLQVYFIFHLQLISN